MHVIIESVRKLKSIHITYSFNNRKPQAGTFGIAAFLIKTVEDLLGVKRFIRAGIADRYKGWPRFYKQETSLNIMTDRIGY